MTWYSSIRPSAAASAASVAPPIAMSPSPGSARNRSISSARPPAARRALPCTADSVVERRVLVGRLPVQHRLVQASSQQVDADPSDLVDPEAKDLVGQPPVEAAVRPDDVAVE